MSPALGVRGAEGTPHVGRPIFLYGHGLQPSKRSVTTAGNRGEPGKGGEC